MPRLRALASLAPAMAAAACSFDEAFVSGGKLILVGSDNQRYMADKHAGSVWVADLPPDGERWADTGLEAPSTMCQNP